MSLSEYDPLLNSLFRAYRDSGEYGDPDPNFMPGIWEKIEARRSGSLLFRRVARVFATGTVALAILIGTAVSFTTPEPSDYTWVETVANDNLSQVAADYEPISWNDAGQNYQADPALAPMK
jgi:hypothetical protein